GRFIPPANRKVAASSAWMIQSNDDFLSRDRMVLAPVFGFRKDVERGRPGSTGPAANPKRLAGPGLGSAREGRKKIRSHPRSTCISPPGTNQTKAQGRETDMLKHNYEYRSVLEASQRINWKIEDVIAGRTFDFKKPFLPETLAGVRDIQCLSKEEKLKLNQIRGFSYLYIFGLVEEYIAPSVIDHAGTAVHGDDYEIRALLRFAEEETKHIQLFKWFAREFERGFGTPVRAIGPASEIAGAIL